MSVHRPQVLIGSAVLSVMSVCFGSALVWWTPVRASPTFEPVHQISLTVGGLLCVVPGLFLWTIFTRRLWMLGVIGSLIGCLVWSFLTVSIFASAFRSSPPPASLPVSFLTGGYALLWIATTISSWYEHTSWLDRFSGTRASAGGGGASSGPAGGKTVSGP
jgi:asparagine N-glycosylation enzyme membrane subunit Stt3